MLTGVDSFKNQETGPQENEVACDCTLSRYWSQVQIQIILSLPFSLLDVYLIVSCLRWEKRLRRSDIWTGSCRMNKSVPQTCEKACDGWNYRNADVSSSESRTPVCADGGDGCGKWGWQGKSRSENLRGRPGYETWQLIEFWEFLWGNLRLSLWKCPFAATNEMSKLSISPLHLHKVYVYMCKTSGLSCQ